MNIFTFHGEQMDATGKRIGSGPIVTFTGGSLTQEWGATKANTLEDITLHDVVRSIMHTKTLNLMISRLRNIHHFKFVKNKSVDRFTLQIFEKTTKLKEIQFPEMNVNGIKPVEFKDVKFVGQDDHKLSTLSWDEVSLTVKEPNKIVVA